MLKRVAHSLGLVEQTDKDSRSKNQVKGNKASSDFRSRSKDLVVRISHAGGQQELHKHAVPASMVMTKYPGMCVAKPEVFKIPHQSVLQQEELLQPGHKYILISFRAVEKLKRKHSEQNKTKEPDGVVPKEVLDSKTWSPSGQKTKENGKMRIPNGVEGKETLDAKVTRSPRGHNHKENGKMKEPHGVAGQEMLETLTTFCSGSKGQENIRVKEIVNTRMDRSLGGGVLDDSFYSAKDFYAFKEKPCLRRKGIKGKKPFVPPLPKAKPYWSLGWQPSLPTVKELSP